MISVAKLIALLMQLPPENYVEVNRLYNLIVYDKEDGSYIGYIDLRNKDPKCERVHLQ